MTYRGVYSDGVVILEGAIDLPNGARVEVLPSRGRATGRGARSVAKKTLKASRAGKNTNGKPLKKRLTKKQRIAVAMSALGSWSNRPEWRGKSSAQIATDIRRKAARRGRHA